jgi:hypothetical protein
MTDMAGPIRAVVVVCRLGRPSSSVCVQPRSDLGSGNRQLAFRQNRDILESLNFFEKKTHFSVDSNHIITFNACKSPQLHIPPFFAESQTRNVSRKNHSYKFVQIKLISTFVRKADFQLRFPLDFVVSALYM